MIRLRVLLVVLLASTVLWAATGRAEIRFEEGDYHPEIGTAELTALGDLNGDGRADALVCGGSINTLALLTCAPDGRLNPAILLPHAGAAGAGIGDIDGDGRGDLVFALPGQIAIRLQHPDGTLGPVELHAGGTMRGPITVADMDRDGHADVVGSDQDSTITVVRGLGGGAFDAPREFTTGRHADRIAVADLDGDGSLDICSKEVQRTGSAWILRGHGDATFEPRAMLDAPAFASGFALGDLDGDGDLDMAAQRWSDVAVCENDGAGHFTERDALPTPPDAAFFSTGVGLADLDADGRLDVIVLGQSGYSFTMHDLLQPYRNTGGWRFARGASVQTLFATTAMVVGDVDGDGHADAVTTAAGGLAYNAHGAEGPGLTFIRGKGDGRLAGVLEYDCDLGPPLPTSSFVTLEFVPEAGSGDALWMFGPEATRTVRYSEAWPVGAIIARLAVAAGRMTSPRGARFGTLPPAVTADLDGDGIADLIEVRDYAGVRDSLFVSMGRGDGSFEDPVAYPLAAWPGGFGYHHPIGLAACDLDRDGDLDVVTLSSSGDGGGFLSVFVNAGTGALAPAAFYASGAEPSDLLAVDLDADGMTDVLVTDVNSDGSGRLWIWHAVGDGTLEMRGQKYWGDYPTDIATGDFDGDGMPDVAYYSMRARTVAVALNANSNPPTPALASLVSASSAGDRASLQWRTSGAFGAPAIVLRSDDAGASWSERARIQPDGDGTVRFEETGLVPGVRYGYRLAFGDGAARVIASETWLTVPASATLALAGAAPNPVAGDLTVAFSLAERAPATLALFDLAGRRIASREVGTLGAGSHRLRLAERAVLAPGLYFVRLTTRERTLVRSAVVVR